MTKQDGASEREAIPKADLEPLLDALVERVAAKVVARLKSNDVAATIKARLLTVEQAATYLGRTPEAVQHMVSGGKLRAVRPDRRVFLDVRDLDRWIEDNKA